jgi:hypothetical protein
MTKHIKWLFFLLPVLFLLLCLLAMTALRTTAGQAAASVGLSVQSVFDTRACAFNSNASNCNGQYPVTTQGQPVVGSGACIDGRTKKFPTTLADANGHPLAELDLYWSPICQSYFAYALSYQGNATIQVKVIEHNGIVVYNPLDHYTSELFDTEQSSQAIHGMAAWSPLLWSPTNAVSAEATFDGTMSNAIIDTPLYVAGVQQ